MSKSEFVAKLKDAADRCCLIMQVQEFMLPTGTTLTALGTIEQEPDHLWFGKHPVRMLSCMAYLPTSHCHLTTARECKGEDTQKFASTPVQHCREQSRRTIPSW